MRPDTSLALRNTVCVCMSPRDSCCSSLRPHHLHQRITSLERPLGWYPPPALQCSRVETAEIDCVAQIAALEPVKVWGLAVQSSPDQASGDEMRRRGAVVRAIGIVFLRAPPELGIRHHE